MRHRSPNRHVLALAGTLALVVGCQASPEASIMRLSTFGLGRSDTAAVATQGSIEVRLNGDFSRLKAGRQILSTIADIDHITLTVKQVGHTDVTATAAKAALVAGSTTLATSNLLPGAATATVSVFDAAGAVIGSATQSATVTGGQITVLTFNIQLDATVTTSGGVSAIVNITDSATPTPVPAATTTPTGTLTTFAGTGVLGFSGDGAAATGAQLNLTQAFGLAVDAAGNLYIPDHMNSRIRKVSATTGLITTVAGSSQFGFSGDGGLATNAQIRVNGVAVDTAGNIFIVDSLNNRIRKVTVSTGIITTVVGTGQTIQVPSVGQARPDGDGGLATAASLYNPNAVAVDSGGNLFIADSGDSRIRKVSASTGIITSVAGTGLDSGVGRVSPGNSLAVDAAGNIFFPESLSVRKVAAVTGALTTVAGANTTAGFSGDGGPATSAQLGMSLCVTLDSSGNLFIADGDNNRIRKVAAATGIITTVIGSGTAGASGDGGPAASAQLNQPLGIVLDATGNFYIADSSNNRVRKVSK